LSVDFQVDRRPSFQFLKPSSFLSCLCSLIPFRLPESLKRLKK
jgi:hypothetical protein